METLEDICQRMMNSGHKPAFIKNILIMGIIRYEIKLTNSLLSKTDPKYKPLHQPSGRSKVRMKRKALAKTKWYRDQKVKEAGTEDGKVGRSRGVGKGERLGAIECIKTLEDNDIPTSTVMFVPNTKAWVLLKMLKDREDVLARITGFRIKFTEAAGTQLG